MIDRGAYIENAQESGVTAETIDFHDWSTIGALALVKGTIEGGGGELTVEARLFDVARATSSSRGKRYRAGGDELRQIAHRFADEIMRQLTGERGPFDSRIAFASRRGGRFKEIYTMSLDGGDLRAVTHDQSDRARRRAGARTRARCCSPRTAPAIRACSSVPFGGGEPRLVSSRRGLNLGGRWSPGGRAIAVALEHGGSTDIALLDPSGELLHWVTERPRASTSRRRGRPTGGRIVFCSDRGGGPQIYVVGADGGQRAARDVRGQLQHLAVRGRRRAIASRTRAASAAASRSSPSPSAAAT